jgi:hypothetical protein
MLGLIGGAGGGYAIGSVFGGWWTLVVTVFGTALGGCAGVDLYLPRPGWDIQLEGPTVERRPGVFQSAAALLGSSGIAGIAALLFAGANSSYTLERGVTGEVICRDTMSTLVWRTENVTQRVVRATLDLHGQLWLETTTTGNCPLGGASQETVAQINRFCQSEQSKLVVMGPRWMPWISPGLSFLAVLLLRLGILELGNALTQLHASHRDEE